MEQYKGKTAYQGIAIGRVYEWEPDKKLVRRKHVEDTEAEKKRFLSAKETAASQLQTLYDKALQEVGEANAAIFEVHQMMLEDEDYLDSILNMIASGQVNAEYAVAVSGDNFAQMFADTGDDYMKERAADVKDISDRLIRILSGGNEENRAAGIAEPVIIVADDLAPSETIQIDKEKVLAFVTRKGSVNSHTAILARTMNIPAIVNADLPENVHGRMAVADGFKGTVSLDPDEQTLEESISKKEQEEEKQNLLQKYKGRKTITKSGKEIRLYANIGGLSDLVSVLQNDAEGIGLFRSEFIYLQEEDFPSEDKQFHIYKQVAEVMAGKKVIIRTLDIGADKQIDYFGLQKEENPALGYRAIRICLTREEIFRTQLRSLLRAAAYGNISIMIPMITSVWEVKRVKEILKEEAEKLEKDGVPYKEAELGIMIETPAAVMIAEELAKEVAFFSIGTNDLTQYTLAVDRQNPNLDLFYDRHHPAVLKMIKLTVEAAHRAGIWAGICGELGADIELTGTFIDMGIDELSMSPGMLLPVKKEICEH